MSEVMRLLSSTTTATPISEAIAVPLRLAPPPRPELYYLAEPEWQKPFAAQLEEISALGEGWDGFKAGPIRRDVIKFAMHILNEIMRPTAPPPHVTPMSHEGLMLEWHQNDIDLEIEIARPGKIWVSFQDAREDIEKENAISSDLQMLIAPITELTKRSEIEN